MQPLNVTVPNTIPSTALSQSNSIGGVLSKADQLSSAYNNYLTQLGNLNTQYAQYLTPSEQEMNLDRELTALGQSERAGLQKISDKAIPMEFITGQQASLQNQAALQRQAISENLRTVQGERLGQLDALAKQMELAQTSYSTTGDYIQNQLDIEKLQREASKLDTNIVTLDNGRTLLVDTQTGNIIKDFGGMKPTSDYGFGLGLSTGFIGASGGQSFDDWLYNKEMTDGISYDTGNPAVLSDLQSQYKSEVPKQTEQSFTTGFNDIGSIESFILRNTTDKDAEPVIKAFEYGYLQAPNKDEYIKDYIVSYLKPKELENYNSAQGIELALAPVSNALETGEFRSGPFVSAQQRLLRTIGKSNPYYESIKTLFSKGKAEERLRLFGASLTTGEQSSARDFLPDERDNSATLKFKVDTMINLSRLAQERQLKQSVGLPMSDTITNYLEEQKRLLAETQGVTSAPSKELTSLRSKYGY